MERLEQFIKYTDWKLVADQKAWLVTQEADGNELATGLLGLLDCLQDAIVADEFATEEEIFPGIEIVESRAFGENYQSEN